MIYVITFDPTKISIDWAHQNDRQNLIFVKAIMKLSRKWPEMVLQWPTSSIVRFIYDQTLACQLFIFAPNLTWPST